MKRFILIFIFLNITCQSHIWCQSSEMCGTLVSANQVTLEKTFTIPQVTALQSLPQVNRTISIMVYVVANNPSNPLSKVVTKAIFQKAIDDAAPYFKAISLSFKLLDFKTVDNFQFDDMTQGDGKEGVLTKSNQTQNCINVYLVNNLFDNLTADISGFAYMPGDNSNNILVRKSFLSGLFLAHQIGHFLGLYHTHESIFGPAVVSGTGCDVNGDRCCDTDADPNISGSISNCIYTGNTKDANNEYFHPSVKNIMSFSSESCQCNFTTMQYMRMVYTLNKFRKNIF